MRIIVAGTIGRSGLGGQAWGVLQYLLGLRALGHEVYYAEDCGGCSYTFMWDKEKWTYELDYPARYVNRCLAPFGLGNRWIYRDNRKSLGLSIEDFRDICAETDLLIMRAVPFWVWRKEYKLPRRRAFIDVDPGFTQITLANRDKGWLKGVARAERRFTFGQRIGASDCPVPLKGGPWLKTVPPVFLPEWPVAISKGRFFTSIIRWQGFRNVKYKGVSYGQRNREFRKFLALPKSTPQKFLIAQMGIDPEKLVGHGWQTVHGENISRTSDSYRKFIQNSRAEFSVPKNGYVKMRGGWFSDRSVCYLASGRPVLIEDTGLTDWLPVGKGLVTFAILKRRSTVSKRSMRITKVIDRRRVNWRKSFFRLIGCYRDYWRRQ